MRKPVVIIADDERPTREVMAKILSPACRCIPVPDAEKAMEALDANPDAALLITDYKMPGEDGVSLIVRAKAARPSLACILVTAFGEIDLAVDAMKKGADDFIVKPITDIAQMEQRVAKAIEKNALSRKVEELQSEMSGRRGLEQFTGDSPAMEKVYRLIRLAAGSNANVLVEGPSGTGKELVARALHELSPRSGGPFVAVECAALAPTLMESELFGHEKGAFTGADRLRQGKFEAASGGTLFLDEITEIDLSVQVKLLRALESRRIQRVGGNEDIPVDFRLVAATNRDLAAYVREGRFREDLYYRLDVVSIKMPPLSERPGDVALLARRFLREFSAENGNRATGFSPDALEALERYSWPGNVRQLRNTVERMVVLSGGGELTLEDVPEEIRIPPAPVAPAAAESAARETPAASGMPLANLELDAIKQALSTHKTVTAAAAALGISRRTLHRKIAAYGLK